jgi:O-antigen/teichoic acid export membrane protein/aminoglycoside phosphotransferase (APT) family kinase protein
MIRESQKISGNDALGTLAHRTVCGMIWAILSTGAGKLITLVSMAILARLLFPEDFGLMTFGLLIIAYVETIGDLGTGMALIYWPSRRDDAAQVTFMLNLLMGLVWLPLNWFAAPLVGGFFNNPSAIPILRALAFYFPIKALGNTHDALLRKDLRFRERVLPDTGMALTKALIAVILAKLGFGVWSLVWGQLFGEGIRSILTWIIVDWRPGLTLPLDLVKPMIAYGRYIVGVNILAAIVHHIDFVIVGKMLGAATLGFYQIAYKLPETTIVMIIRTTGKVLFPAFSKLKQGTSELRKGYIAALRYVSILSVPIAIGFLLLAEPLVLTVFGETWRESIPILRALGLAACFRSLGSHAGDIFKATGRTGLMMGLGVLKAIILIPALILAAYLGPAEVAVALALVMTVTCSINIVVVCRIIHIPVLSVLSALRPSITGSMIMTVSLLIYLRILSGTIGLLGLIGGIVIGMGVYFTALAFLAPDIFSKAMSSLIGTACAPSYNHGEEPCRSSSGSGTSRLGASWIIPVKSLGITGWAARIMAGRSGQRKWEESRTVKGANPDSNVLMGEVDRFLVPARDRQIITYFLDHLFNPHNRREHIWRFLFKGIVRLEGRKHLFPFCWSLHIPLNDRGSETAPVVKKPVPEDFMVGNKMEHLGSMISMVSDVQENWLALRFQNNPIKDLEPFRWISLFDYQEISRNRIILFLFPKDYKKPVAVLKLRDIETSGRELAVERDALEYMETRMPHELKTCVPYLLNYGIYGKSEALLMSLLPGHSMEHELARRPAKQSFIIQHFQNAAQWLARFHIASRKNGCFFEPDCRELTASAEELNKVGLKKDTIQFWTDRIHTLCVHKKVPLVASHGDFWARNLLLSETDGGANGSALSGVVDWERFSEEAPPFEDLFHFPLTYGFNYHWFAYQKRSPEEAFRLAFLKETPVSRSVRQYFKSYCEQTVLSHELLEPLFRFFLLDRWIQGIRKSPGTETKCDKDSILWIKLYQMLDKADRSVFSG